ncbi:YheU family protein [Alloalcanivorax profundimaris]|uniref:YheU family protein n=1 Tax=Alloalcanivorax profundimaris TaxID=2735259 RepID=UPI000C4B7416|nr:hypothetical protein [Alcanivorax sp.]MBF1801147.1 YheU family protein [Alloalcanivorax profundimaris]QJX01426.1 YheU family protein [Alcanivorax sp. IO_7]MAO60843.1 hypothetical protein [Alcanivorax sp.]MAY10450.1 hypothetical protein [Alcanivorax sp.]|tara:strand:- start:852 stop:1091 length:240 start_codon:yes stop_codon:yes gene_type:complete
MSTPIIVPWSDIDRATLDNLIEEFVTRDGTDYGEQEVPTATKVEQVRAQLKRGEASVVFDDATETVSVMTREQLRELGL